MLSEPEADEKLDPTIAKEIAQIRMSKPTSNSGKFNTSGAINDVGTHTDLEVEQVQLIPDNCLQTDCMDKLEQDLADLAESHLDADPDADGSVQDMLDVNTVNKKSPSFTSNNESPTKKAEGESVNVSSPVKVVPGSPVRAVPAAAEPVAEPVIQEGLRQRHPPHEHRHVAPVAPVAARPVQAAVARRPELFDVILDGLITLTIAALIYVGSGIAMKLA